MIIVSILIAFMLLGSFACRRASKDSHYNILLISLDTVRFDALGYAGKADAETPNIDALARNGSAFMQAISTNSLTTPAHCSLFTGRYPTAHGVHNIGLYALSQKEKTLAEFLKEHGYQTAAFVSAFPVSHRFGLSKGFDIYDDRIAVADQEEEKKMRMADIFAERSATEVTGLATEWMKEKMPADKPFFLFLHYFDPHFPYDPPPEFVQRFGTGAKERYAGEIAYVDTQLKKILSALEQKKALDKTIIIALGDHGESLGEHGEDGHGIFIYDSTIRIPLFFSGGPIVRGKTFNEQVSIIDIFPTIVDLLGFPIPEPLQGRSLKDLLLGNASTLEDRPYYIESYVAYESFGWAPLIGMRMPSEKLIRAPRPELYAFKSDPLEEKNLYQADPGHTKEIEDAFTSLLQTIAQENEMESDQTSVQLSGQERDLLHSLGYIGAGVKSSPLKDMPDPKDRIGLYRQLKEARSKLLNKTEVAEALNELRQMEKVDQGNMTLRLLVGKALQTMDRTAEAESYYLSLTSEYPRFTLALNELAALMLKREGWADAAKYYQKSLGIDPIQIELYPNLAYALMKMDRVQEAVSLIDRALTQYPGEAALHGMRGELAYQTKDYAASARHFSAVHDAKPNDLKGAQDYARALLMCGEAAQGAKILGPFASRYEEDVGFQIIYGQCLSQAGRFQEGLSCFERALRMEESPVAHYFLGLCLLKLGKVEEAKQHFNKLKPDDPNYQMSRRALESLTPHK